MQIGRIAMTRCPPDFLSPGRSQDKKAPLGGSQRRSRVAWGPFLSPGRSQDKKAPLGGSQRRSRVAWGPFLSPGRSQDKKAPLGAQPRGVSEAFFYRRRREQGVLPQFMIDKVCD